jgi:hypothetical protein
MYNENVTLVMAMSVAQYSGRYLKNHMRRARRICEPDIIKLNFPILFTKKINGH